MQECLFNKLLMSVEQAGAIRRGETPAERSTLFKEEFLTERWETGTVVWSIQPDVEEPDTTNPDRPEEEPQ